MKIALYAGTYVKDKDGAVRSIYQLVASFRKHGHEVIVWSSDVSEQDNHGSLKVLRLPSVPIPLYPDYKLGFFSAVTKRQLDAFAPDIVHISTPDIVGRRFLLYAKNKKLPATSVYHTDFPSYLSYYRLGFALGPVWKYLKWFYNTCDLVLAPNEIVQRKLTDKSIRNVEIWSRGIDRELFDPSRRSELLRQEWHAVERTVFVYAGRFVLYKDIEVVMSVYERFMREGFIDKVRFVMIGSGPEEEQMRRRMPQAVFTGYLIGTALPEAYASGDVFLFPSTTEAFGNVVLEAFATGLPAVVSDVGGCMELVNASEAGLVAKAGDIDQFYAHCLKLLDDAHTRSSMRRKGVLFAEKKSWASVNGALIARYLELIAAGRSEAATG
ncbi:MAG: glycosyltransferase family 1 protein [Chlorobium limicola]|uniref:Glycosyl transferase group 1 n=1 Tax=Chlorobium limicola (strain DSM 245 / NBRC 103803 / 6330) TaxID=290315 RepID=B3EGA1_CHLL2|nr:glycosyltransferase family 1 protein [Chlorobium limicola]ACD91110.1 glycosyl transferase group 1 [Chlorobium limicola DSM 245]NTV08472.1 glycosyltransferase family 1 protein [Chlorobium limicola]NTV20372.1 glycosyltransferase family 1 protein [Chlorobium limicola]